MGYGCIGIDIRGFGKSSRPWDGYSYDRLADDIRVVAEYLCDSRILRWRDRSMGGAIAIRYMARHDGHGVSKLAFSEKSVCIHGTPFPYEKQSTKLIV